MYSCLMTLICRTWTALSRETPGSFGGLACRYKEKQNRRKSRRHSFHSHSPPCPAGPTRPAVTGSARVLSPPVSPQRKRRAVAPRIGAEAMGGSAPDTNTTALRTGGSGPVRSPREAGPRHRTPAQSHTHSAATTLPGLGHVLCHLVAFVKAHGHGVADGHGYGAWARWTRMDTDPPGLTRSARMAPHRKKVACARLRDRATSGGERGRGRAEERRRERAPPGGTAGVL